jgi:hypothetical protein
MLTDTRHYMEDSVVGQAGHVGLKRWSGPHAHSAIISGLIAPQGCQLSILFLNIKIPPKNQSTFITYKRVFSTSQTREAQEFEWFILCICHVQRDRQIVLRASR